MAKSYYDPRRKKLYEELGVDTSTLPDSMFTTTVSDSPYYTRNKAQQEWFNGLPYFGTSLDEDAASLSRADSALGYAAYGEGGSSVLADYWNSLTDSEKLAIARQYETRVDDVGTLGGLLGAKSEFDNDRFIYDLLELANTAAPEKPVYEDFYRDALEEVDAENAKIFSRYDEEERLLDELLATRQSEYSEDLNSIRQEYGTARQGILSQQAAQNARLSDTMTSQMERSRRNALEAGASAGIRLAGNVNAMLSTQNQMAQTSLDTSNQLAQMLLNQRNAERGARNDYNSYMQQDASNRAAINSNRSELELNRYDRAAGRADSKYSQSMDDYNERMAAYDNATAGNPQKDSWTRYTTLSQYSR